MTEKAHITGRLGESAAADFLIKKGFVILERNFRHKSGEIDIIARDGKDLVFVEVKNYQENSLVHPLEVIGPAKQRKIKATAQIYLSRTRTVDYQNLRFDVVTVRHDETGLCTEFELFIGAF